jgi:peptidoglycan/LPS O-acetylase OafA/YrhL
VPLLEMFGAVLGLAVVSATASYLLVERPILGLKVRLGWWSGSPARPLPPPAPGGAPGPG